MGHRLRSHLDHLHPDVAKHVRLSQERQKTSHDKRAKCRAFKVDDPVMARNFNQGPKWLSGTVTQLPGPYSLVIRLDDGQAVRKHIDQVRHRVTPEQEDVPVNSHPPPDTNEDFEFVGGGPPDDVTRSANAANQEVPRPTTRCSSRIRRPPDRLEL